MFFVAGWTTPIRNSAPSLLGVRLLLSVILFFCVAPLDAPPEDVELDLDAALGAAAIAAPIAAAPMAAAATTVFDGFCVEAVLDSFDEVFALPLEDVGA
jgi:hypothetical protein